MKRALEQEGRQACWSDEALSKLGIFEKVQADQEVCVLTVEKKVPGGERDPHEVRPDSGRPRRELK